METLVAVSIFTLSILSMMAVLSRNISDTNYIKSKMAAEYLAQEGIECVRNMRDNYVLYTDSTLLTWADFKVEWISSPEPQINCLIDDPDFSGFARTIAMTEITPDEVRVESKVEWVQESGDFEIILTENLFNWTE
ncbi:MAG: hypothetical protein UT09_C0025G0008 [Parcubacteria group bacterium GW2011_GWF2_38_8]|nr:MAG: hypothetical protein UT09_C0025G0008 [Parcubacteria group bacterium GW2011_GWF2_38_8]